MATDSVTDGVRDDASDLIDHFNLEATHSHDHTIQTSWERGPVPSSRKVKIETRWDRGDNIGHGAFGAVWVERNNSDANAPDAIRAVKEVSKAYMKSRGIDVRRELIALAILSKNPDEFVQFLGWFEDKSILYITMEYMPLGDLASFVEKGIPEREVKVIALQLLEGLSLMHRHSLTHRDLKPANIFVKSASPQWFVKIGDFGITKRCRGDSTVLQTEVGTQGYLAPEIAVESQEQYTNACDLWSLGCVVYKALTQVLPFPRYRDLEGFCSGKPFPVEPLSSKNVSANGEGFLEKLLAVDPTLRPTAELALTHDWLLVSDDHSPSAADFQREEFFRFLFHELTNSMYNTLRVGLYDHFPVENSINENDSRNMGAMIRRERDIFSGEMGREGRVIIDLSSEGHPEIRYTSEAVLLASDLVKEPRDGRLDSQKMYNLSMGGSTAWLEAATRYVNRCSQGCLDFLAAFLTCVQTNDVLISAVGLLVHYLHMPLSIEISQADDELKQLKKDVKRYSDLERAAHTTDSRQIRGEKSEHKVLDLDRANMEHDPLEEKAFLCRIFHQVEKWVYKMLLDDEDMYGVNKPFSCILCPDLAKISKAEFHDLCKEVQKEPDFEFVDVDGLEYPTGKLWIHGLPVPTNVSSLESIFKVFGRVDYTYISPHSGHAWIYFEKLEAAMQAKSLLDGKEIFPGAGPVIIDVVGVECRPFS